MSVSAALQKLIFDTVTADAGVMALVNGVYDHVPKSPWGETKAYVSFGPSDVIDDDADCIAAGEHTFQIDCWSRGVGKVGCRRIVDAVKDALHARDLALPDHGLVELRVTMRRVFDDPDGRTAHGVVTVAAMIEESEDA